MGRGQGGKQEKNLLRPGNQLDSRDVIFKSGGRNKAAIKQAETEEAEKFAQARKRKES